jgi:hypothetical protein
MCVPHSRVAIVGRRLQIFGKLPETGQRCFGTAIADRLWCSRIGRRSAIVRVLARLKAITLAAICILDRIKYANDWRRDAVLMALRPANSCCVNRAAAARSPSSASPYCHAAPASNHAGDKFWIVENFRF